MESFQSLSFTLEDIKNSGENIIEDDKEMNSLITDNDFIPLYEQYSISIINKIIKDNYKKIETIFEEKNYSIEEIIADYRDICFNILKYKDNYIKSANLKNKNKNFSISCDKIFNDEKLIIENNDEKVLHLDKKEINNFLDSFYFNGKIYELHIQSLLMQIFKCFEIKENSFQFLCNIDEKNIKDLNEIKLDFAINNIDSELFEKSISFLSKNILLCNLKKTYIRH